MLPVLCFAALASAALPPIPSPTLREVAGNKIFIGSAVNYAYLSGQGTASQPMSPADVANYSAVAGAEFSIITAENALKAKHTEPVAQGVFNFTEGDAVVAFAKQHEVTVRGHNLVWVAHNPAWLVKAAPGLSGSQLNDAMHEHIAAVATHYKGQVYSWDVVNEGIVDVPKTHICSNWTCALKASASSGEGVDWTRANDATGAGVTYVEAAFAAAHAADPEAKLFFNEYAVHAETTKFEYMYMMLHDLVRRGVPVHGVGLQTHVQNKVPNKAWNETGFRNVLRRLTVDLELEVHVSELNVPVDDPMYAACAGGAAGDECKAAKLAGLYADVLRVCMEFQRCRSFEMWGFTDAHSSYGAGLRAPGAFLYDSAYEPKQVRAALAAQLASTPTPRPTPPPTPPTPAPPTPPPTPQVCAAAYQKCGGGPSYTGPTCCDAGCTCEVGNPNYSQCKPAAGSHSCSAPLGH